MKKIKVKRIGAPEGKLKADLFGAPECYRKQIHDLAVYVENTAKLCKSVEGPEFPDIAHKLARAANFLWEAECELAVK